MTDYIPVVKDGSNAKVTANNLKIHFAYSLGGINYGTYQNESRGYYLHVTPVNREVHGGVVMESFQAFTGTKLFLLNCMRQSPKQEAQAIELAKGQRDMLIQHVLKDNGLKLANAG